MAFAATSSILAAGNQRRMGKPDDLALKRIGDSTLSQRPHSIVLALLAEQRYCESACSYMFS